MEEEEEEGDGEKEEGGVEGVEGEEMIEVPEFKITLNVRVMKCEVGWWSGLRESIVVWVASSIRRAKTIS